jgi:hypothetical protein
LARSRMASSSQFHTVRKKSGYMPTCVAREAKQSPSVASEEEAGGVGEAENTLSESRWHQQRNDRNVQRLVSIHSPSTTA